MNQDFIFIIVLSSQEHEPTDACSEEKALLPTGSISPRPDHLNPRRRCNEREQAIEVTKRRDIFSFCHQSAASASETLIRGPSDLENDPAVFRSDGRAGGRKSIDRIRGCEGKAVVPTTVTASGTRIGVRSYFIVSVTSGDRSSRWNRVSKLEYGRGFSRFQKPGLRLGGRTQSSLASALQGFTPRPERSSLFRRGTSHKRHLVKLRASKLLLSHSHSALRQRNSSTHISS